MRVSAVVKESAIICNSMIVFIFFDSYQRHFKSQKTSNIAKTSNISQYSCSQMVERCNIPYLKDEHNILVAMWLKGELFPISRISTSPFLCQMMYTADSVRNHGAAERRPHSQSGRTAAQQLARQLQQERSRPRGH